MDCPLGQAGYASDQAHAPTSDVMMSEEMFIKVRPRQCVDLGNFPFNDDSYQPNPHFTNEQNQALEAYESGMRAKEYKSKMKREKKKAEKPRTRIEHNKTVVFN